MEGNRKKSRKNKWTKKWIKSIALIALRSNKEKLGIHKK